MTIERFDPVGSSTIGPCEYDTETNELQISFLSGGTYVYNRVPRSVWDGLKGASSAGSYWHKHKSQFAYRRA